MTPLDQPREDVFASGAYWREYYAELGHENAAAGEFLREVAEPLMPIGGLDLLDAGCGPTVLYWTLFVPGQNRIEGFDLNPANIAHAQRQIEQAKLGTIDPALEIAARHAVDLFGLKISPAEHIRQKAQQIRKLAIGDLAKPWPCDKGRYDFVQSVFALECLPSWEKFDFALKQAAQALMPGGRLALVNVSRADEWHCNGMGFPTLNLTLDGMKRRIATTGLDLIEIREVESKDVSVRDQGYGSIILTAAEKTPRRS